MLVAETVARIWREHFAKGKTIREIARDLRVSRNTVRKVLRSGETSFEYERNVQPRPKLGQWTAALDELLEGKPRWLGQARRDRRPRGRPKAHPGLQRRGRDRTQLPR
jgi:DNA-binding FadR family transcriptional regulator